MEKNLCKMEQKQNEDELIEIGKWKTKHEEMRCTLHFIKR